MTTRIAPVGSIPPNVLARAERAAGQPVRGDAMVYQTLANHPDLFAAWLAWGAHVVRGTTLSPALRELVILRVTLLCDGRYPLTQHVRIGKAVGLGQDEIERVACDAAMASWGDDTAAALCAVDQLLLHRRLDDRRWDDLVGHHGVDGALDVIATVAFYRMACWMLNASQTPFDKGQVDPGLELTGRFEACDPDPEPDSDSVPARAPRLVPRPLDEWPASLLEATETWPRFAGRPELRRAGVYSTLAHHPALFRSIGPMMAHLLQGNGLTDAQREIVIVRSCLRDRGAYPYRQHVGIAAQLGVAEQTRQQLANFEPAIGNRADAALVAAVDELHLTNHISDRTWAAVRSHLEPHASMDLIATAGFYGLISFVLTTAQTPLEPGTVNLPKALG